jgi:hypothetical protein
MLTRVVAVRICQPGAKRFEVYVERVVLPARSFGELAGEGAQISLRGIMSMPVGIRACRDAGASFRRVCAHTAIGAPCGGCV